MDGMVKILYEDLKISVLKKDDETKELKKEAGEFRRQPLVKDNNPSVKNHPVC